MLKQYLFLVLSLFTGAHLFAQVTLEECVKLAQDNYPLIRKYDLLNQTKEVNLSDINKSWLRKSMYTGKEPYKMRLLPSPNR